MADIAVLGGGHGAYAAAADLTHDGHRVTLWRRDAEAAAALAADPQLTVSSPLGDFTVRLHAVTADLGEAVAAADLLVVPLPATAQDSLADALAPHLRDGQVVYLPPGTFGAYAMARRVRELGNTADVAFAETGTLPYLARKHGPQLISLSTRATNLPTGVFPARHTDRALEIIRQAYPQAHPVEDALSAALMNAGPIIHPPLIIMNAGPLDRTSDFDIHNEGTQPVVRRVATLLDEERIALREALGYTSHHYPLADHYELRDWMYGPESRQQLLDSDDWREPVPLQTHRYMREDLELGLGFLTSVADWAGLHTPIADGLLALGGAACGEDFSTGARTWDTLGLAGSDREAVRKLLHDGF